jgi:replication factor C subunit 2/4
MMRRIKKENDVSSNDLLIDTNSLKSSGNIVRSKDIDKTFTESESNDLVKARNIKKTVVKKTRGVTKEVETTDSDGEDRNTWEEEDVKTDIANIEMIIGPSMKKVVHGKRTIHQLPWVDKYRPRVLREVVGHEELKNILRKSIETGDLPHLLFHGSSGTGKTSTVLALAMQLYGPNKVNQKVLELNASDENGINVVREKIISFAKIVVGTADPNYPSPSFKMIILDEADSMTSEAQTALKKVMEVTCNITRFVFICNYENKIIEPIKSRCFSFRFIPIPKDQMIQKLKNIANNEGINISDDCLNHITDICEGDARRSIMTLQNVKYITNNPTKSDIYTLTSYVDDSMLDNLWDKLLKCSVTELLQYSLVLTNTGYPMNYLLACFKNKTIKSNMSDEIKSKICIHIANVERMLAHGSDNQLLSILAHINGCARGLKINDLVIF